QAGLALFLAVVGLYGLVNATTSQRTREIGIRLAMGATGANILLLILRQGTLLTIGGLTLGLLSALAMGHWLRHLLYDISSGDALTYLAAILVLGVTTLVACWIPARRAAKTNPMEALRYE
ncbi:FtsX-like permease family protein, partial [Planctomycetota bacterium]